jgi:uncharacterized protein with PQ loop repeat
VDLYAVAVGVAGAVLAGGRSVPQLVRILRRGHAEGVALSGLVNGIVSSAGWAIYSLLADQPSILITSLFCIAVLTATLIAARRHTTGSSVAPIVWAVALGGVLVVLGTQPLGFALAASAVVNGLPQLRRVAHGGDLSGIAAWAWALCLVEGFLWLAVGLASGDPAVIVWAGGQLVVSAAILVCLRWHQRSSLVPRVGGKTKCPGVLAVRSGKAMDSRMTPSRCEVPRNVHGACASTQCLRCTAQCSVPHQEVSVVR